MSVWTAPAVSCHPQMALLHHGSVFQVFFVFFKHPKIMVGCKNTRWTLNNVKLRIGVGGMTQKNFSNCGLHETPPYCSSSEEVNCSQPHKTYRGSNTDRTCTGKQSWRSPPLRNPTAAQRRSAVRVSAHSRNNLHQITKGLR